MPKTAKKTAPLRKEIEKLEKELDKLTSELGEIEHALSDQSLYDDDNKDKLLNLLAKQSEWQKQVADIEENLLLKMDELETLENALS